MNVTDLEAVTGYIDIFKMVYPKVEDRIIVKNMDQDDNDPNSANIIIPAFSILFSWSLAFSLYRL